MKQKRSVRTNNHNHLSTTKNALPVLSILIIGIFIILSISYEPHWSFKWSGIRDNVKDSVGVLRKYGYITSRGIGLDGDTPFQYHTRLWLMKNASFSELMLLKEYPHNIIRTIAYEGLLKRKHQNSKELIFEALNDSTTFFLYKSGCSTYDLFLPEYIAKRVV